MNFDDLAENHLVNRQDFQNAIATCLKPVQSRISKGCARVSISSTGAHFPLIAQEMEGFCRLLWGIVPLVVGGGHYHESARSREGLINGTDPEHPEFWGLPSDYDQRLVEFAAIAYALIMAPEIYWAPLSSQQRRNVVLLLSTINNRRLHDNNWRFFRVLVNLALALTGSPYSEEQLRIDLDRIETFYVGDGWYSDGLHGECDYYASFAMQFYGLIYATHSNDLDPQRSARFRDRAAHFATEFICWFSSDGSAIPFGRSLAYRFAQVAFWGSLALANIEIVPWGIIKGLILRHLRWWFRQPIFSETGLLTIGYGYSNLMVAEKYTSPSSPYWALKAFVPAALPEFHPFWLAIEADLPDLPDVKCQHQPKMIMCRDRAHVFALTGGSARPSKVRNGAEKYAKFCYSTHFGFSIPCAQRSLASGAHDSMLALSTDGKYFRVRIRSRYIEMNDDSIVSTWNPWPDIAITTWLIPLLPWHIRVHCVRTGRRVMAAEGGFAIALGELRRAALSPQLQKSTVAAIRTSAGISIVGSIHGYRTPYAVNTDPNTNVLFPRSAIPTLLSRHSPGSHWIACCVRADSNPTYPHENDFLPSFHLTKGAFEVCNARRRLTFATKKIL